MASAKWQSEEIRGPITPQKHGKNGAETVRANAIRNLEGSSRFLAAKQMLNQEKGISDNLEEL